MSSLVRSVLGAALLLTGTSAAMAASGTPPVAGQPVQTGATTATAAPVAGQPVQTGAATAVAATTNAPVAGQAPKSHNSDVSDKTDRYGGHDPNSTAGTRAFWEGLNPY